MSGQSKKSLNIAIFGCYIFLAITVLMVGRENPVIALAQTDAASVFFVAVTFFALERQIMAWCTSSSACRAAAVTHNSVHHSTMSMVAQAGQSSGWPVSDATGILTPVWAIASERENSSDSIFAKRRRMPSWLQPQQKNTQNPRSPNSATTAAARFTVRRWWLCTPIFILLVRIQKTHLCICPTYFPISTTILRL
ncbi:ash family protein [Salmonella enterica]|nr:ash family protein [Salmonella enterica]